MDYSQHYLQSDHPSGRPFGGTLGSLYKVTNWDGSPLSPAVELRYYPFGQTRYAPASPPTALRFTGQRQDSYSNSLPSAPFNRLLP